MGISNIGKFIKDLGACNLYDLVSSAARKSINSAAGRTRITLQAKELEELGLQHGLGTIKHPKLIIGGNNTKKGQSVWNVTVCDNSGKPVESLTIGYDTTRGKNPICQQRRVTFDGEKKIFTESEFIDSNKTLSENPIIESSVRKEKGTTIVSVDVEGAYKIEQKTVNAKKVSEFKNKTGLHVPDAKSIKKDLKLLYKENAVKDRLDYIRDIFKVKTPYMQKRFEKIQKMDLKGLDKEIQIQQSRLQKQEQELEQIYAKVFGTGEGAPNWREEFIDGNITKINPITKKPIPEKTIKRIKHKMNEYNNTRALIATAAEKKHITSNFKELDGEYISRMLSELKIETTKNIDSTFVKELQALKGLPKTELIEKVKNIICKKVGLPEDLIKIEPLEKGNGLQEFSACFAETKASLYYHPTLLKLPDDVIIGLIRHELDHFEVIAKMAKKIGYEKFKNITSSGSEEKLKLFDDEQWRKVIERITVEDNFNPEPYMTAIKEYTLPWGSFSDLIKYLCNPLELRAYEAGFYIETALNGGNTTTLLANSFIKCKIGTKIQAALNELQNIASKGFMVNKYMENLKTRAANSITDLTSFNFETEFFNQALKIIRQDLEKAKAGNFNDSSYIKVIKQPDTQPSEKFKKVVSKKLKKSVFKNLKDFKVTPLVKNIKKTQTAEEKTAV